MDIDTTNSIVVYQGVFMFVLADTAGNKYRQVIAKVAKSNLS